MRVSARIDRPQISPPCDRCKRDVPAGEVVWDVTESDSFELDGVVLTCHFCDDCARMVAMLPMPGEPWERMRAGLRMALSMVALRAALEELEAAGPIGPHMQELVDAVGALVTLDDEDGGTGHVA